MPGCDMTYAKLHGKHDTDAIMSQEIAETLEKCGRRAKGLSIKQKLAGARIGYQKGSKSIEDTPGDGGRKQKGEDFGDIDDWAARFQDEFDDILDDEHHYEDEDELDEYYFDEDLTDEEDEWAGERELPTSSYGASNKYSKRQNRFRKMSAARPLRTVKEYGPETPGEAKKFELSNSVPTSLPNSLALIYGDDLAHAEVETPSRVATDYEKCVCGRELVADREYGCRECKKFYIPLRRQHERTEEKSATIRDCRQSPTR